MGLEIPCEPVLNLPQKWCDLLTMTCDNINTQIYSCFYEYNEGRLNIPSFQELMNNNNNNNTITNLICSSLNLHDEEKIKK